MDEVEHAVGVGQRIADLAREPIEPITSSDSSHVDSIARALLQILDKPMMDENAEEEEEDSDEVMETEIPRLRSFRDM